MMNNPAPASSTDRHLSTLVPVPGNERRPRQTANARIRIDGLSGAFEAARLERRLDRLVGVVGAHVNSITDYAHVAYDPALTSPTMLVRQIEHSGFRANVR
jgi:cation transport ATPase